MWSIDGRWFRLRAILTRCGSLLLLFQRVPLVKNLLPEARVLSVGATGEIVKWTVAAVAGLGTYDSVAGATLDAGPTIEIDPASVTINSGGTATLGVYASGAGFLTYQWYQSAHGGAFTNIRGAIGSTYTTSALTVTTRYFVRVSNRGGSVYSNPATVSVITPPVIKKNPTSVTIKKGARAILAVKAKGTSPAYQWFMGVSGDTSRPIAHAKSATYRTPPLDASSKFWVRVKNPAGKVNSETAVVKVDKRLSHPFTPPFNF